MTRIALTQIVFDAGTQIRETIDQQVVTDYADAMTNGARFPPIVLFHDGTQHYLADGFHRFMAAQRLSLKNIDADVKPGTKEDAIWFALGANRTNGQRLTMLDKTRAIARARDLWPAKMQSEIAKQIGCHPSLVSNVYQKLNGSQTVLTGRALKTREQREAIRKLATAGTRAEQIAKQVGVSRSRVAEIRAELGLSTRPDQSRAAVIARRTLMREMAAEGHTSRHMAAKLGITEEGCRQILRQEGIDVPADNVTRKSKHHDPNRIVERIVSDAENLTECVNLINFADLDRKRLREWLHSLAQSRDKLSAFIRRLMKEQHNHGEAA